MSQRTKYILLAILLIAMFLANIFFGAVRISPGEIIDIFTGYGTQRESAVIVLYSRLPQSCVALLAGAALAVSGLMLQTFFANPLADASIMGIHSGAGLGAAIVLMALGSVSAWGISGYLLVILASLSGAVAVILLLLAIYQKIRNNVLLLIMGLMMSYIISSVISLLSYIATADNLQAFFMWGMGSFGNVSLSQLPIFTGSIVVCLLASLTLVKPLNAMLMGEHYAQNAGMSLKWIRTAILLTVGMLSAIVVSFCGPITFIGLAVPHITRMFFKTNNHLTLMPATMLTGAVMALVCNFLTTFVSSAMLIPINVVTPFVGVPVIFYVLWKKPLYRQ